MKLITRVQKASKAAEKWKHQYQPYWRYDDSKRAIHEALVALGKDPDPDEVDRVIGNGSWTICRCDECEEHCDVVLELGETPDYGSATAQICKACFRKAAFYLDF